MILSLLSAGGSPPGRAERCPSTDHPPVYRRLSRPSIADSLLARGLSCQMGTRDPVAEPDRLLIAQAPGEPARRWIGEPDRPAARR